jgi:hypothetical protein
LTTPLLDGLNPNDQTVVAEVDLDLLANTVLEGAAGVDFADLTSEARTEIRWRPAPDPYRASLALRLPGSDGDPQLQGCRPLTRRVEIATPADATSARLVLATVTHRASTLRVGLDDPETDLGGHAIAPGTWTELRIDIPRGGGWLWLESPADTPPPCLESLTFL